MAAPELRACPHCGSTDTAAFADGSGHCRSCGRAFRGSVAQDVRPLGSEVESGKRVAEAREKERLGLLGIFGGLLAFVGIPAMFLIGSVLSRQDTSTYVADVINTPRAAITCGGASLLIVAATYAFWAGSWVWRGNSEKSFHLLVAGLLCVTAAAIASPGVQGIVGILGGTLALVSGLLAVRKTRRAEAESKDEMNAAPQQEA